MSYHLYQTRGFILQSTGTSEADRTLRVFTEELGLINIRAQGTRKPSSKLRPFLKEFSFVQVVVVRGRNSWRLTDIFEISSFSATGSVEKLKAVAIMFLLVSRFVQGEDKNPALFGVLSDAYAFLSKEKLEKDHTLHFETLAVLKILASLGYIGENHSLTPFLSASFSKNVLDEFTVVRRIAVKEINRALEESQL